MEQATGLGSHSAQSSLFADSFALGPGGIVMIDTTGTIVLDALAVRDELVSENRVAITSQSA